MDVSDFFFFSAGEGEGGVRDEMPGGVRFLLKIPGRGGCPGGGGAGEGVCSELGIFFGGGAKYFFFGAEMSTEQIKAVLPEHAF